MKRQATQTLALCLSLLVMQGALPAVAWAKLAGALRPAHPAPMASPPRGVTPVVQRTQSLSIALSRPAPTRIDTVSAVTPAARALAADIAATSVFPSAIWMSRPNQTVPEVGVPQAIQRPALTNAPAIGGWPIARLLSAAQRDYAYDLKAPSNDSAEVKAEIALKTPPAALAPTPASNALRLRKAAAQKSPGLRPPAQSLLQNRLSAKSIFGTVKELLSRIRQPILSYPLTWTLLGFISTVLLSHLLASPAVAHAPTAGASWIKLLAVAVPFVLGAVFQPSSTPPTPPKGGHTDISRAAWSPDGSLYLMVSSADQVRVYARDGTQQALLGPTVSGINDVRWSPNSRYVAIQGIDRLAVWDAVNGRNIFEYENGPRRWLVTGFELGEHRFSWSADSQKLLVENHTAPSNDGYYWGILDVTGRELQRFKYSLSNMPAWNPVDPHVFFFHDTSGGIHQDFRILDTASGADLQLPPSWQETIDRLLWSPDGSHVAISGPAYYLYPGGQPPTSGRPKYKIVIFNIKTGRSVKRWEFSVPDAGPPFHWSWSPDGTKFSIDQVHLHPRKGASLGFTPSSGHKEELIVWDVRTEKEIMRVTDNAKPFYDVNAVPPSGNIYEYLWFYAQKPIWSPGSNAVLRISPNHAVVWSVSSQKPIQTFTPPPGTTLNMEGTSISPDWSHLMMLTSKGDLTFSPVNAAVAALIPAPPPPAKLPTQVFAQPPPPAAAARVAQPAAPRAPPARVSAPQPQAAPASQTSAASPPGALQPGTIVNGYTVIGFLAQGGMGILHKVHPPHSQEVWVLKNMQLPSDPNDRAEAKAMFSREFQLLQQLRHPGLPRVQDFYEDGDNLYFAEEFIEGQNLEDYLDVHGGRLDVKEAVGLVCQLLEILSYLHTNKMKKVIYRDVKPSNIMVLPDGSLKLVDFGAARQYQPGKSKDTRALGTPGFAPPEQYGRGQTDERTDIYGVGVLLHYLLTGDDPTQKPDTDLWQFTPPDQLAPRVPSKLSKLVMKALEILPAKRFKTARRMRNALQPFR